MHVDNAEYHDWSTPNSDTDTRYAALDAAIEGSDLVLYLQRRNGLRTTFEVRCNAKQLLKLLQEHFDE